MHHPGLSDEEVAEIQYLWDGRTTIARLAKWYRIDEQMVRRIIAAPRKEATT